jgi:hypothetical protein
MFIEASQEYYESLFTPSDLKDSILINVIDYFTEKWNELKSDGQKGEMKGFILSNNKNKTKFKRKNSDKVSQCMSYRNSKPQKIKKEDIKSNRKLSELLNVINMLQNREKKVELLKEHVYFNYEFMISKALINEMSFVVGMQDELLKLNDKELIDISQIYIDHFPSIEDEPKILIIKVLSRLESRSKYVRQLSTASTNLFLLQSYIKNENVKDLFIPEKSDEIESYYLINGQPYVFIITKPKENNWDKTVTSLHLINSTTKQDLGQIELINGILQDIQIIIYDDLELSKEVTTLNQLNGRVYLTLRDDNKVIYSIDFKNEISILKKFNEKICQILILNTNILSVFFANKILLLNLESGEIHQNIIANDVIHYVKSTMPEANVFSICHFGRTEFIKIIVVLDKEMEIYQFNSKSEQLALFCKMNNPADWIKYEWRDPDSLLIDESYLIDNIETISNANEIIIRFVIESEENSFKIIEVKSNYQYSVVGEIDETKLGIEEGESEEENHLELISIYRNKIILKSINDYENQIFIYDLGNF